MHGGFQHEQEFAGSEDLAMDLIWISSPNCPYRNRIFPKKATISLLLTDSCRGWWEGSWKKAWRVAKEISTCIHKSKSDSFQIFLFSFLGGEHPINHIRTQETVLDRCPPVPTYNGWPAVVKAVYCVCRLACILGLTSSSRQVCLTSKERHIPPTSSSHESKSEWFKISRIWLRIQVTMVVGLFLRLEIDIFFLKKISLKQISFKFQVMLE